MNIAVLSHIPTSKAMGELRVAPSTFRSHSADLREILSFDDFDFLPHDKAISLRAYAFLQAYIEISKILGKRKALEHLKLNGIEE